MKNFFCFVCFLTISLMFQNNIGAQRTATWKGGTPGRNADWTCASNWKEGKVPNEFSDVFIPDVVTSNSAYPVVGRKVESINSLTIYPAAHLYISADGNLEVIDRIACFSETGIHNSGTLLLPVQPQHSEDSIAVLAGNCVTKR